MTTTFNFLTDSVRNNDGNVDVSATLDKVRNQLMVHVAERETEQQTISDALNTVFDRHPGARLNMPCLVNAALTILNTQPENYNVLRDRVHKFVQENASMKREDGKMLVYGVVSTKSNVGAKLLLNKGFIKWIMKKYNGML